MIRAVESDVPLEAASFMMRAVESDVHFEAASFMMMAGLSVLVWALLGLPSDQAFDLPAVQGNVHLGYQL